MFVAFVTATLTSIIDSIADYYACAKMSHVPPPPLHAVNRGIACEGFMSMIAGFFGAGHATTTYGGNIGTIGMTKVQFILLCISLLSFCKFKTSDKIMANLKNFNVFV